MRLWLLATALLGLTFVGGQVYEFTTFYHEGLALKTNLFGIDLLHPDRVPRGPRHGRHPDAAVAGRDVAGPTACPTKPTFPVEMVGLYWHFVDIVWIVIFTVVYLIPTGCGHEVRMSATSETQRALPHATGDHAGDAHAHREHPSPQEYVRIGADPGRPHGRRGRSVLLRRSGTAPSIPTLLGLMFMKFVLVVLWFMHLKFDDRRFARFFVMGLALALTLYLIVLIDLRVFLK